MRLLLAVLLVLGCKGKPTHQAPPKTAKVATAGSGPVPAPEIVLPAGSRTAPLKTTKALAIETLQKLSAMTFPGFQIELRGLDPKGVVVIRQKTADHPRVWSEIEIKPCFDCLPMELAKWQDKTEALKVYILPVLRDQQDTDFEVGQTTLNGQTMIYTYQLGSHGGEYTNAYYLYYNDGVNQIRASGEYQDEPATKQGMTQLTPREDLENVAKAFMDVYTHAWATS